MRSFAKNRGTRGVHFYDSNSCEFLPWDEALPAVEERFPENFSEKLLDAMANYDPSQEFIAVSAGAGQLTIELFKSSSMWQ